MNHQLRAAWERRFVLFPSGTHVDTVQILTSVPSIKGAWWEQRDTTSSIFCSAPSALFPKETAFAIIQVFEIWQHSQLTRKTGTAKSFLVSLYLKIFQRIIYLKGVSARYLYVNPLYKQFTINNTYHDGKYVWCSMLCLQSTGIQSFIPISAEIVYGNLLTNSFISSLW